MNFILWLSYNWEKMFHTLVGYPVLEVDYPRVHTVVDYHMHSNTNGLAYFRVPSIVLIHYQIFEESISGLNQKA